MIGGKLHEDGNAADQNSSSIHGLLFGPTANDYESARFLTDFPTFQQFQFGMHSVELCCPNYRAMAFWRQTGAGSVCSRSTRDVPSVFRNVSAVTGLMATERL